MVLLTLRTTACCTQERAAEKANLWHYGGYPEGKNPLRNYSPEQRPAWYNDPAVDSDQFVAAKIW